MRRTLLTLLLVGVWMELGAPAVEAQTLLAAVLPASRSVAVNTPATAFATIINTGSVTATGCGITAPAGVAATFSFQTTNPATNQLTGTLNTAVSIAPGQAQTFVFAFTPTAPFAPTELALTFSCTNTSAAPSVSGLNTFLLSASSTPPPDIVALGATLLNDGTVGASIGGGGVFAVATVNVGAAGTITASADTGPAVLALSLSICQTNPATGQCVSPPGPSATTVIGAGQTPTFAITIVGTGNVPFDPAHNRIFVRFRDGSGTVRGATSVAATTAAPAVSGSYTVSTTLTISGCRDPADDGSTTEATFFQIPSQTPTALGASFGSTVTEDLGGGLVLTLTLNGAIDPAGMVSGAFSYSATFGGMVIEAGNGTLSGSIARNGNLSLVVAGQDTTGDTCHFTASIMGHR